MDSIVLNFLKKCKLQLDNADQLQGLMIPRSMLLSEDVYNSIKSEIIELKKNLVRHHLQLCKKAHQKTKNGPCLI